VAIGCVLCILHDGFVAGYGSRKEEYVDKIGDPKALFPKSPHLHGEVADELRAGYVPGKTDTFTTPDVPGTGSIMMGEAGDNIGRGGTTALYVVDESAFLSTRTRWTRPWARATACRIDISTPNGLGNPFAQKRFDPLNAGLRLHHALARRSA
jgi:phage terminase large subunit